MFKSPYASDRYPTSESLTKALEQVEKTVVKCTAFETCGVTGCRHKEDHDHSKRCPRFGCIFGDGVCRPV